MRKLFQRPEKMERQMEWNGDLRGERKTIEYQGT